MKLLLSALAMLMLCSCGRSQGVSSVAPPLSEPDKSSSQSESSTSQKALVDKSDWKLVLVNRNNPLPNDFSVELESVRGYEVDKRIADDLNKMCNDAENEGIDLLLCYGYRTYEQAQQLFTKQVKKQEEMGLVGDEAVKEAQKWVAPPGTSEHHTGLALDIVTPSHQVLNHEFADTDAAKWMAQNAYKYGFILRYPSDKEEVTGIAFEPWHYRYVGREDAKIIFENKMCLEEYLEGK